MQNPRCLIDLHLHIDGAMTAETARALAAMQGEALPTDDDAELLNMLRAPVDCRDLNEYLERFALPCSLMQTSETVCEAVYRLCEKLIADGVIYAELRFAPQLHTLKGLTQEEVVMAALSGIARSSLRCALILCCMRGDNNVAANLETIRLAHKYRKDGVCAADLAGAEALFPTADFCSIFALAKKLGLDCTIHAGEAAGADSVIEAIEMGAKRIGHGVHAISDPNALSLLQGTKTPLELCITSNLQTKAASDIADYPLRAFMDAGITVTLNTDNPTVSGTTVWEEFLLAQEKLGITDADIKTLLLNAADAAFTDEATKAWLREKIKAAH